MFKDGRTTETMGYNIKEVESFIKGKYDKEVLSINLAVNWASGLMIGQVM